VPDSLGELCLEQICELQKDLKLSIQEKNRLNVVKLPGLTIDDTII